MTIGIFGTGRKIRIVRIKDEMLRFVRDCYSCITGYRVGFNPRKLHGNKKKKKCPEIRRAYTPNFFGPFRSIRFRPIQYFFGSPIEV